MARFTTCICPPWPRGGYCFTFLHFSCWMNTIWLARSREARRAHTDHRLMGSPGGESHGIPGCAIGALGPWGPLGLGDPLAFGDQLALRTPLALVRVNTGLSLTTKTFLYHRTTPRKILATCSESVFPDLAKQHHLLWIESCVSRDVSYLSLISFRIILLSPFEKSNFSNKNTCR